VVLMNKVISDEQDGQAMKKRVDEEADGMI